VSCHNATCRGIVEITKTITIRTRIGHTKRYRVRHALLRFAYAPYAASVGSLTNVRLRLSGTALRELLAVRSHRITATLVITSASGTTRRTVLLHLPVKG